MTGVPDTVAPVVRVRGEATRRFAPDHAELSVSVERTSAVDRAAALEQASATAVALREALDRAPGVREVVLSRVVVREATQWNPSRQVQEHTGWVAYLGGHVKVDAAAAGDIAGVVAGTEAGVSGVVWGLDDRPAAQRETRIAAVTAAREAAEDFAVAVDRELGELRVVADQGLSGGPPQAFALSAAGAAATDAPRVDLDPEPVEVYAAVEAAYLLA